MFYLIHLNLLSPDLDSDPCLCGFRKILNSRVFGLLLEKLRVRTEKYQGNDHGIHGRIPFNNDPENSHTTIEAERDASENDKATSYIPIVRIDSCVFVKEMRNVEEINEYSSIKRNNPSLFLANTYRSITSPRHLHFTCSCVSRYNGYKY